MSNFTKGADLVSTNGLSQADSIVPVTITASTTLIAGTHRLVYVDPTAGSVTLTLPTEVDGVVFEIIRVVNGNNTVTVVGNINGQSNGTVLGFSNQYIKIIGDATNSTYRYLSIPPSQFGTMTRTTQEDFSVTTTPTKYNEWETILATTAGVLDASLTTDDFTLTNFEGNPQMGYRCAFSMNFEATNNRTGCARLVFDGTVGAPIILAETCVNSLGTGKPVSLSINGDFGISETGIFRIELEAESSDTWAVMSAKFDVARVTG